MPLDFSIMSLFIRYWMLGGFDPSEGISSFIEDGSIQADNPGMISKCESTLTTDFLNFRHTDGKESGKEESMKGTKNTFF